MAALPRKGWRFRAREALPVSALTTWRAPFTGGGKSIALPAGEEFEIAHDVPDTATAAACMPLRYDDLHSSFVTEQDRHSAKYGGYYLVIKLSDISEKCDRVA
jgi:hypothetical protein